jgi:hypothetical protein
MYFPLVLAGLVIVSAVYLLRQFWTRSLGDDDVQLPEDIRPSRDDASRGDGSHDDALKAA